MLTLSEKPMSLNLLMLTIFLWPLLAKDFYQLLYQTFSLRLESMFLKNQTKTTQKLVSSGVLLIFLLLLHFILVSLFGNIQTTPKKLLTEEINCKNKLK